MSRMCAVTRMTKCGACAVRFSAARCSRVRPCLRAGGDLRQAFGDYCDKEDSMDNKYFTKLAKDCGTHTKYAYANPRTRKPLGPRP
eukprot:67448-Rhodomonas_salina.3